MRAIGDELAQRMIPELTSADARERAALARMVLDHLAADLDVLPEVAQRGLAQEFSREIESALQALPAERLGSKFERGAASSPRLRPSRARAPSAG